MVKASIENKADTAVEDLELIRKFKSGDESAFDRLVIKYQKKIYWMAYRMTGDHDDADDLAQETFVRAYVSLDSFKEEYRFYTWLYRIALNLIINHQKKHKRTVSLDANCAAKAGSVRAAVVASNPTGDYEREQLAEAIDAAVHNLPERYRKVFCLRVYEELSYQEIAEVMGISIGTVMSRLNRAREKLKKTLSIQM